MSHPEAPSQQKFGMSHGYSLAAGGSCLYGLICLLDPLARCTWHRELAQPHLVEKVIDLDGRLVVAEGDREGQCRAFRLREERAHVYAFLLPVLEERLVLTLDSWPDITSAAHNVLRRRRAQPLLQLPRLLWVLSLRVNRVGQTIEHAHHAFRASWQLHNSPRDFRLLGN